MIRLLAVGLAGLAACTQPPERTAFQRLANGDPASDSRVESIGDTQRRVLDPLRSELVFPLDEAPSRSRLVFAIGSTAPDGAILRFEIELRARGEAGERVYTREIGSRIWTEGEVDFGGRDLRGHELVLRKSVVEGDAGAIAGGVWGNPVLLPAVAPPRPSVLLVSLDTLRADRVGAYASERRSRTPALDAFAGGSLVYETAYAPATWTLPSHRALLSGVLPVALPPLPALPSVATRLRRAGLLTAGFTGGGYVSHLFGLGEGFDLYYEFEAPKWSGYPACNPSRLDGPHVFRRATDWLRRYGHLPFFLFVHTYDAHDRCPFSNPRRGVKAVWRPEEHAAISSYYDRMIGQADGLVGGLLTEIERLGLAATTVVVVTSDHGEAFWEHGVAGHGPMRPYEELARVPLIVRAPGRHAAGARVVQPVSLVDVAPTLLGLLGLPLAATDRDRVLPGLGLGGSEAERVVVTDGGLAIGVRTGAHKLITAPTDSAFVELFDLATDPTEQHDLAGAAPATVATLEQQAAAYAALGGEESAGNTRHPPGATLDPKTREQLRALGYVE